jgi:hypothetical protein
LKLILGRDRTGRYYVARLVGSVEVECDRDILHEALKRFAVAYMYKGVPHAGNSWTVGGESTPSDYVGGFWDTLNKGFKAIGSITKIPLVQSIVRAIPFGGTLLTGLDLAGSAVGVGQKLLGKVPKPARMLATAAAKSPQGRAMLAQVAKSAASGNPRAVKMLADVRDAATIMRDVGDLQRAIRSGSVNVPPEAPTPDEGEGGEGEDVSGDYPAPQSRRSLADVRCPMCRRFHNGPCVAIKWRGDRR